LNITDKTIEIFNDPEQNIKRDAKGFFLEQDTE
jgi:hypothetical protein